MRANGCHGLEMLNEHSSMHYVGSSRVTLTLTKDRQSRRHFNT
jgi:hypothetical protein